MRHIFYIGLMLTCFHICGTSQIYSIPQNVKKVVFLGNSITYMGLYVSYIDAYLTVRYPGRKLDIINVALPSETVSGLSEPNHADGKFPRPDLHERLARVLTKTKPDLVFACYGMNDGIFLPYDEERFRKYKEGIVWLHDQILKSGAAIIHVTPPVFDNRKGEAYSNVLDIYSDWLLSCRYVFGWKVIDIHWPMKKYLEDRRSSDSTFIYAKDGVHPDETGHFIMARQILQCLGESEVSKAKDLNSLFCPFLKGNEILTLVEKRQAIMKDAWLTFTEHKRPGMNIGLAMPEARLKAEEIDKQIREKMGSE